MPFRLGIDRKKMKSFRKATIRVSPVMLLLASLQLPAQTNKGVGNASPQTLQPASASGSRQTILLDEGWKFVHADIANANAPAFNDSQWETVTVPHDWAIKGPFDKMNDAQTVMVVEDGEKKPSLRVGRTGGLPWTGVGWYRKQLNIPASAKGKRCFIEFDGAMSHAVVYLNGKKIGTWPYGYASFSFELTDDVQFGKNNTLAVRLENAEEASRWYPGAGLYRNVRLVFTEPVHIPQWGTYITTPSISDHEADVQIKTTILNQSQKKQTVVLYTVVNDPSGKAVATKKDTLQTKDKAEVTQHLTVNHPLRWDITTPRLYTAVTQLVVDGKTTDNYTTSFGIRTISFDADRGFILNGKQQKLQGVCMHHDLGPLGAAVNTRAIERQLEIMKAMGCNAIRTSHNPPAPELLDLCDKMGFVVMDEAFDEWKIAKCKNGYHLLFDEWAEKDLRAMIRRDRNHPSIVLWSIGNEVSDQKEKEGAKTARFLTNIAHDEDSTRMVTAAFNRLADAINNGLADAIDVVGFNYQSQNYLKVHKEHPQWRIIGSETESTVSSRGAYKLPVMERKGFKYADKQSSAYDVEMPKWGSAPDIEFSWQDANPFVAGAFVWTGFDYLGEPTPYNNDWPSRSSYFGIVDLAGLPKDRFYLYQSKWSDKQVLHLLPHWNWQGKEDSIVPVHCYTSYTSAELFVNGKSQGVQVKDASKPYGRYRLTWDNVRYQPGEIKVVAFNEKGSKAETSIVRTAGEPVSLMLTADRRTVTADGKDLSFITVQAVDKNGNPCPLATNNIRFSINGEGLIRGVCNGDATSVQNMTGNEMQLFNGRAVVIVQSSKKTGDIRLSAASDGIAEGKIDLKSVRL